MKIAGKTYWIVGASDGLGAALAHELASKGARLALSARRESTLTDLAAALPGGPHAVAPCDVVDTESIRAAAAKIGPVDGVAYVAGYYDPASAQASDLKDVLTTVDVNLSGMYRVIDQVLPDMLARGAGHIVLFGSLAGFRGLPGAWGYGATKAACMSAAESLALDLRKTKIKVQCVNPGFVKTRLTDKNDFSMPFIMTPDKAARRIAKGMTQSRFAITFPVRFALVFWTLRLLPVGLYTRAARWLS